MGSCHAARMLSNPRSELPVPSPASSPRPGCGRRHLVVPRPVRQHARRRDHRRAREGAGRTAAQVMLSWHWQEGAPPSLSQPSRRTAESFDVSDFDLTDAEPAAVDPLDIGTRGGPEPDAITMEAFGREIPEAEGPASLDSSRGSGKGLLLIVTCPRCFSFDDVRPPRRLPDGRLEYTCTGEHDDTGAYMWSTASSAVDSPAGPTSTGRKAAARTAGRPRTSLVAEDAAVDELLEPLLACVNVGEPFVEYGIVEYRFRMSRPDLFVAHVRERGHPMLGARRGSASTSTARFARTLRRLETTGQLVMVKGPGTGAWRHDQSIGYWARPPRPTGPLLTWSMFCATQGRTAEWTDEDRALPDTS